MISVLEIIEFRPHKWIALFVKLIKKYLTYLFSSSFIYLFFTIYYKQMQLSWLCKNKKWIFLLFQIYDFNYIKKYN